MSQAGTMGRPMHCPVTDLLHSVLRCQGRRLGRQTSRWSCWTCWCTHARTGPRSFGALSSALFYKRFSPINVTYVQEWTRSLLEVLQGRGNGTIAAKRESIVLLCDFPSNRKAEAQVDQDILVCNPVSADQCGSGRPIWNGCADAQARLCHAGYLAG